MQEAGSILKTKRTGLSRFRWLLVGRNAAFNLVEEIEEHGCMVGRLLLTGGKPLTIFLRDGGMH
jgi:hypothetical protein